MANRVIIRVLGQTLAPYDAHTMGVNGVSEDIAVNVAKLGTFRSTTATQQAKYPLALAYGTIEYKTITSPNTIKATKVFINITPTALNSLANA